MSLANTRIVIIGGSSGLGFAVALASAHQGAEVIIASSSRKRVDHALARLPAGTRGHGVDVTREPEIEGLFAAVGAFDHLVFTAGETLHAGEIGATDLAFAQNLFRVRYWGAFASIKHGARNIRTGGSIVLTSGGVSQRPWKGASVTASMCAAVEALARAMAVELAPIRVNVVQPGLVDTELWDAMPAAARAAMYERRAAALPVGHVGAADDVAQTYLHLMQSRFTTGATIVVDGGAALTQPR